MGLPFDLLPNMDAVVGVKAVYVLGLLAAAVGVYGFVRDNWGRAAGYVAAALLVYAPYVQYVDPHARGALAESFSFGMLALALWALNRLRLRASPWSWLAVVLTTTAVILSHNLMALLFFGLLFTWVVWQFVSRRWQEMDEIRPGKRYGLLLAGLFLGLGLAAFFWVPVALEREAVNLTTLLGEGDNFDFRTHFLSWREMLSLTKRLDWGATEPFFRFNMGIAQWTLAAVGVVLLIARKVRHIAHLTFFALATAVLVFMMLPVSTFIWQAIPFLPYFQFPWRLLGATAVMLAILGGAGVGALTQLIGGGKTKKGAWMTAVFVLYPILLALPLVEPIPWPDFGPVLTIRMTEIEHTGRWLGTTSTADYVPATVEMIPGRKGSVTTGFYEEGPIDRINWAQIPEGTNIETEEVRPLLTRYRVTAPESFPLRLFLFDFPGWQVTIDGDRVETELGRPEGFIVIPIEAGEHMVEVKFGSTPPRTLAFVFSFISLLLMGVVAWRLHKLIGEPTPDPPRPNRLDWTVLAVVVGLIFIYLLILGPSDWLHHDSIGNTAVPAQTAVSADFGQQIRLIGYDTTMETAVAGESLDVTLYWKAAGPLDINYQVFLHLLTPEGFLVVQSDKLNPGEFPTRRWPPDKYVRDDHTLALPADLPSGEYLVYAGLWVQTEGWRLPLLDDNEQQIGDNYLLFKLVVE